MALRAIVFGLLGGLAAGMVIISLYEAVTLAIEMARAAL